MYKLYPLSYPLITIDDELSVRYQLGFYYTADRWFIIGRDVNDRGRTWQVSASVQLIVKRKDVWQRLQASGLDQTPFRRRREALKALEQFVDSLEEG